MQCACGLAYLSPRPKRESIGFYYQDLYSKGDGIEVENHFQHSWIARILNRLRWADLAKRRVPETGERHLDVGCGVGAFLIRAARNSGATAVGVDFDRAACESARDHGRKAGLPLEIHQGMLADQAFAPGEFATVSMIHFLEHTFDPCAELGIAHRLLASGGAIVVEVPSFRSIARGVFGPFWLPYLAPQHLVLFSQKTLRASLEKAGFTDVRVHDSWAPLIWTISFMLWYHRYLGGKSRFAKNPLVILLSIILMFTWMPLLFVFDLILSLPLALAGRGEHIRATAVRP